MATLDDLRGLGYEVGLSFEGDGFKVYRVEGFGLSTQVRDDDPDSLQSIVDQHDEAVKQQDETTAEMQLRWHRDPDHPLELDDETVERFEQQATAERRALDEQQAAAG